MKFGIFDHLDASGEPLEEQYRLRLKLVELYENSGFYCYHLAEHHCTPLGNSPSPAIFLSAAAQRTQRIKLGPLVYTLPFYHPLRLIEEICMLDRLSEGRLQLGVGRGISPLEISYYGLDPDESQERYFEILEIVRSGLSSETLNFQGRFYQFSDVPMVLRPKQIPYPPLWYGTNNPDAAVWAAANDVNVVTLMPAAVTRQITDRYRQEWQALGKDKQALPLMGMTRHIVVADTTDEAMTIARRAYLKWRRDFVWLWEKCGQPEHVYRIAPPTFDELVTKGTGYAGSPDSVIQYLNDEIEQSGASYMALSMVFGDISYKEAQHSVELFAGEVMPAFTGTAAV